MEAGRIPLHVVTGFLGAGKTTLINRLLSAPELAETLVIVNEWGVGYVQVPGKLPGFIFYEELSGRLARLPRPQPPPTRTGPD